MPYSYPAAPPTISSNIETISRFLAMPTFVQRRLRDITQQRFIGDVILSGRYTSSGGAVEYEINETIYADAAVQARTPGSAFARSSVTPGNAAISPVTDWGLEAPITDESIKRARNVSPLDRAMIKLANSIIRQVDTTALAAVASAVAQTQAAAAAWSAASPKILLDVMTAKATILNLNQGYDPDTVVVSDQTLANAMSDPTLAAMYARENPANPVYTGMPSTIGGLMWLPTPNIPVASTAFVLDSKLLGAMVDEEEPDEQGNPPIIGFSYRDEPNKQWICRGERVVVPIVQEPAAAVKITGV